MSNIGLDSSPNSPKDLLLSEQMKARISKGEICEELVREKTAECYTIIANAPHKHCRMLFEEPFLQEQYNAALQYYESNKQAIDLGSTNSQGFTLLSYAMNNIFEPMAERLTMDGALTTSISPQKDTLLSCAASDCPENIALLQLALNTGCSPYQPSSRSKTPLGELAMDHSEDSLKTLKWFLSQGINAEEIAVKRGKIDYFWASWMDCSQPHTLSQTLENLDTYLTERDRRRRTDPPASDPLHLACLEILQHLQTYRQKWEEFKTSPDATKLSYEDLMGFSNIGKLHELLGMNIWHGHEDRVISYLHTFPPFLSEEVIEHHSWISHQINPAPNRWSARIEKEAATASEGITR